MATKRITKADDTQSTKLTNKKITSLSDKKSTVHRAQTGWYSC